ADSWFLNIFLHALIYSLTYATKQWSLLKNTMHILITCLNMLRRESGRGTFLLDAGLEALLSLILDLLSICYISWNSGLINVIRLIGNMIILQDFGHNKNFFPCAILYFSVMQILPFIERTYTISQPFGLSKNLNDELIRVILGSFNIFIFEQFTYVTFSSLYINMFIKILIHILLYHAIAFEPFQIMPKNTARKDLRRRKIGFKLFGSKIVVREFGCEEKTFKPFNHLVPIFGFLGVLYPTSYILYLVIYMLAIFTILLISRDIIFIFYDIKYDR
ncbi:hypothetical protein ACJX0J_013939, partial [Zea mays]